MIYNNSNYFINCTGFNKLRFISKFSQNEFPLLTHYIKSRTPNLPEF